jgi:hypothetical protein
MHPPTTAHNYLPKVAALYQQGLLRPSQVHGVDILHDDWCDALDERGYCNCEPEVRLKGVLPTGSDN